MRVIIVAPPYPLEEAPAPPLGVTYVAAAFERAGAQVKILDYIVSRYTPEKLRTELDAFGPDLIGTTSVTMNLPAAARILRDAKRIRPSALTVLGGPHVSFDAERTLRDHPHVDLAVLGEAEETIRELSPASGRRADWARIRGLAYLEDGRFVSTPERPVIQDLETLPLPARHLLPVSRYLALGFPVSIITSRGCPYPCIFCQGRRMVGRKVRYREAGSVVDEIETILAYGFERINIADDLFLSDKDRARTICGEIRRRGLRFSWSAFARVNILDRQTLIEMRDAGCDTVSFGIESGNPEMLKRIRKGITLEQGRRAAALCKEVGILPHVSFMVGLPGETHATLRDTRAFAESLGILFGYHFLAPFPGTTVREELDRYDLEILTDDWSRYDANRPVTRTRGLTAGEIEAFVRAFEARERTRWEGVVERFRQGKATPEESLRVLGQDRMNLTYRLLSDDVLEEHGRVPLEGDGVGTEACEGRFFRRVRDVTGFDVSLVEQTLRDYMRRGYIKCRPNGREACWYWTHSLAEDVGPFPAE